MTFTYYKVFTWYFLIGILEFVYTGANDPGPKAREFVNYNEMERLLNNAKSVFINGHRVYLGEWLPSVLEQDEVETDINLKTMFTFVKCECAHLTNASVGYIENSIKLCSANGVQKVNDSNTDAQNCLDNEGVTSRLESLNKLITLAVTVLFEIGDRFRILKTNEPHFLKTILATYFYIESLTSAARNEGTTAYTTVDPSDLLAKMNRVVLQISNLIGRYTMQYCYPSVDGKGQQRTWEEQLNRFRDFLTSIVSLDTRPPYQMIDMNSIMLNKCAMRDNVRYEDRSLETFCHLNLKTSYIRMSNRLKKTVDLFYADVEHAYDVERVYEYMHAVYEVILKLIYRLTPLVWNRDSLDADWCTRTISKLRRMNCPIEMIDTFELALKVEYNKNLLSDLLTDAARTIFIHGASRIENVELIESKLMDLSLADLVHSVTNAEFKHFWWVFNLLYYDAGNESNRTYDVSLNLFAENNYSTYLSIYSMNEFKCNALAEVYRQCLYTELKNDECKIAENDIPVSECLIKVHSLSSNLSDYLIKKLNEWVENVSSHDDLYKIFLDAIIILKNNFNIDPDIWAYQSEHQIEIEKQIMIRKQENLKRTLDVFTNMLDNYQIKNCRVIKNCDFVYENEFIHKNEMKLQIVSGDESPNKGAGIIQSMTHVIGHLLPVLGGQHTNIPAHFYNFAQLTERDSIKMSIYLGKKTFFNWHGEMKSMRDIHINISENMFNTYDLVEYQRLYVNWAFFMFYRTWFNIADRMFGKQINVNMIDYDKALACLVNVNDIIFKAPFYDKYERYFKSKLLLHQYISMQRNTHVGREMLDLIETEIISPMTELLGVIKYENDERPKEIFDIQILTKIGEEHWNNVDVYSTLFSFLLNTVTRINMNYIFLE